MAVTAYWIAHKSINWVTGTITGPYIKNHVLADGTTPADFYGSEEISDYTSGSYTLTEQTSITGVLPDTNYKIAWVVYDSITDTYSNVSIGEVTTLPGTIYWVLDVASGWSTPSALQITQGKLSSGTDATWKGSENDTGENGFVIEQTELTGLTNGTTYKLAWVWTDNGSNYSDVVEYEFTYTSATWPVRPSQDILATGWTSTEATLYDALNEETFNDGDYITSPDISYPTPAILQLSNDISSGSYILKIRARKTDTSGQLKLILLDASQNNIGSSDWQSLTTDFTTYNINVTATNTARYIKLEVQ